MRKNRRAAIIVICTVAIVAAVVIPRLMDGTEKALVIRVIDGDTVELADGRHVRYLGIDAPESGEYYAENATERNKELVEGKTVELIRGKRDKDEYGRLLRYVYVDGVFVNAELIAGGYAKVYMFDPDDWRSEALVEWEDYAILRDLGLWNVAEFFEDRVYQTGTPNLDLVREFNEESRESLRSLKYWSEFVMTGYTIDGYYLLAMKEENWDVIHQTVYELQQMMGDDFPVAVMIISDFERLSTAASTDTED